MGPAEAEASLAERCEKASRQAGLAGDFERALDLGLTR